MRESISGQAQAPSKKKKRRHDLQPRVLNYCITCDLGTLFADKQT